MNTTIRYERRSLTMPGSYALYCPETRSARICSKYGRVLWTRVIPFILGNLTL